MTGAPDTELRGRATAGLFWASVETWSRQIVSLLVFLVLARLLGPADLGRFAFAVVFLEFLRLFVDEAIGEAIVQLPVISDQHLNTAFWFNNAVGFVLCLSTFFSAPVIGGWVGGPEMVHLFEAMSLLLVLGTLTGVHQALLRRQFHYQVLAIRSVSGITIGGMIGVTLAWKGYGLWALVAQQATERIVAIVVLWIGSSWKPRFGGSVTCLKDLLKYTAPAVLARSTDFAVWQLDRAALGIVYPPEVLGAYVLARQVMTTVNGMLLFPTTNVMFGFLSRLQGDALLQAVATMLHLMSLVMMPIFIGLSLVSADLVIVIFGSQWGASAAVLPVLVIAGIPYFLALLFLTVSRSRGAPGKWMWVSSTVFVTNMALIALLHPFGLVALAMAFAIRDCLLIPFYLLMLRQLCGLQINEAVCHMMMPAIGTSVMAVAVLCARSAFPGLASGVPNLVLSVTIGVVAYVSVMAVLDRPIVAKALDIGRSIRLRKGEGGKQRAGANPLPQVAVADRDAGP